MKTKISRITPMEMASFFEAIFLCLKKDIMYSGTIGHKERNCCVPEKISEFCFHKPSTTLRVTIEGIKY